MEFSPALTGRQGELLPEDVGKTGAGIFKQSMGARNRVGYGLSYRPSSLQRLAELIPWNRFLGSLKKFTNSGSGLKEK